MKPGAIFFRPCGTKSRSRPRPVPPATDGRCPAFPRWGEELARELVLRLELDLTARPRQLSRGQRARFALVLALAHRPRLLLLDDPTLGLDPAARRLLIGELLGAAADEGTTILLSTHLLAEVDKTLDRLLILHDGGIVLDEPVADLKARWRRLVLPPGAPPAPPELLPVDGRAGVHCTRFREEPWRRYCAEVPAARAEPSGVEDIFIALTGGAA